MAMKEPSVKHEPDPTFVAKAKASINNQAEAGTNEKEDQDLNEVATIFRTHPLPTDEVGEKMGVKWLVLQGVHAINEVNMLITISMRQDIL